MKILKKVTFKDRVASGTLRIGIQDLILAYFVAFTEGDAEGLKKVLGDDVILRDWAIEKRGITEVVNTMAEIKKSLGTVKIQVDDMIIDVVHGSHNIKCSAIIEICPEGVAPIKVVDVFKIEAVDEEMLMIIEIDAYKQ